MLRGGILHIVKRESYYCTLWCCNSMVRIIDFRDTQSPIFNSDFTDDVSVITASPPYMYPLVIDIHPLLLLERGVRTCITRLTDGVIPVFTHTHIFTLSLTLIYVLSLMSFLISTNRHNSTLTPIYVAARKTPL